MKAIVQDEYGSPGTKHHRVVVPRHGGPDVLQVVEEALPEPQAGEVRVKVLAAGISGYDLMDRRYSFPGGRPCPTPQGRISLAWWTCWVRGCQPSSRARGLPASPWVMAVLTQSSYAGPPISWCPSPRAWILPRPSAWWQTTSPRTWLCTGPPTCAGVMGDCCVSRLPHLDSSSYAVVNVPVKPDANSS
jgi:hypothetical protein